MMQTPRVRLMLIFRTITVTLLAVAAGCSQAAPPQSTPIATPLSESPTPTSASPSPPSLSTASDWGDAFSESMDRAMSAATITQSAISPADWKLVANQWEQAIAFLKLVPSSHPKKQLATQKIAEYQRNLAYAKQQAVRSAQPKPSPIPVVASQPKATPTQRPPATPPSSPVAQQPQSPPAATPSSPVTQQPQSPPAATPSQPTPVATVSANLALAQHLQQIGAKVYETYWCPFCQRQQESFGAQAYRLITRIECDPRGENAQPELCRQANIRAYPTWEIKGQIYEGGMSLETLADVSGYQGSRNFSQ